MEYLRIRNWDSYQDTAGRGTSYVKVQTSILTDMEYMCMPNEERLCFLLLLVYAGVNANKLPADPEHIQHLCHLDVTPDVTLMIKRGLVEPWDEIKHNKMLDKHQHKLNMQNERKRRQRDKEKGHATSHAPVTPPSHTETETETETDLTPLSGSKQPNGVSVKAIGTLIDFLGEKTGRNYQTKTPAGKLTKGAEKVKQLMKHGYTETDIRMVIARKTRDWKGGDMDQYLTPDTLFRPSKFEKYLSECVQQGAS